VSGDVLVEFVLNPDGAVNNVSVVKSSNRLFNEAATAAVAKLHCIGQSQSKHVQVPFKFRLE